MKSEAVVEECRGPVPDQDSAELAVDALNLVWRVAGKVRGDTEQKLAAGLKNDMVGVMKFVSDWHKQLQDTAHRSRQYSWWVTGLGVLDGEAKGDTPQDAWSIRRAQFALSAETTAAAIVISPMTAAGKYGRLCVVVTWQECLFDVAFGEKVMANLERWLLQIASTSET